jgi:hypothetical protein
LTRQALLWLSSLAATLVIAYAIGVGSQMGVVAIMATSLFLLFSWVGTRISKPVDSPWLPRAVALGFLVKLAGSSLRYAMVKYIYGFGDSFSYHAAGVNLADVWRTFEVPLVEGRSAGTRFIELLTSALYAPYEPHMLGGFFLYSALAFTGQLLLYAAFRRALPNGPLKMYAALVFIIPTFSFWPSSIGKDAVMLLAIGLTSWAAAGLFETYRLGSFIWAGAGIGLAAAIRPHMAGMLIISIGATMLLSKAPKGVAAKSRRVVLIGATAVSIALVATLAAETFGVDLSIDELDPLVSDIERRTGQGGSAVTGSAVSAVGELPAAFIRILFRPLPMDAHNSQALVSALEGTFLLGVFIWKLPSMIRGISTLRRRPYVLFTLVYSTGFVIAFSAILNYGILARQRSQVMGLFLALVLGLGVRDSAPTEDPEQVEVAYAGRTP